MTAGDGVADVAREPDRCSAPFRVRFDEAGPDGLLRTSVLLRYAQDLAWFHSAQRGFDRAWYRERGLTWLVRAAEVEVTAPMRVGDALTGTTSVVGWRRVWARRRTEFVDAAGEPVAWVHIDWVLLDARGAPTRIPSDFDAVFGAPGVTVPLGRVALDLAPPTADKTIFTVRPQELDPMDHVNNAVYADWLEERILHADPDAGRSAIRAIPRRMRLEYARAAEPGATIVAETWRDVAGSKGAGRVTTWSCRIGTADGVELLRAQLG